MSVYGEVIERTRAHVREQNLFHTGRRYILALSGGADSTLLLHVMNRISAEQGLSLIAASLDHGLRSEAGRDLELVRSQAAAFGIPFHAGIISSSRWEGQTGSPETAARRLRFRFLLTLRDAYDADGVVTGHNRTDHMETLLMNIHRGTGIRGLTGLLDSGLIIRPLLTLGRDEIRQALVEADIPFQEDATNLDTRMLRNRVRQYLLHPMGQVFGDQFEESWIRLSQQMRDSRQSLTQLLEDRFGPSIQCMPGALRLLRDAFPSDSSELQQELVLWLTERITGSTFRMNRSLVEQTACFLKKDGYGRFQPFRDDTLSIIRSGRWITFVSDQWEDCSGAVPGEGTFPLWFGTLHVGNAAMPEDARPDRWIDAQQFPFPWCLEPVQKGDVIGGNGRLTDALTYLKKAGVGAFERNEEPVLKSGQTVLLVPDLDASRTASSPVAGGSIPVYMDRPMGYNPRRLQKADPIGSDHPKEARKR